MALLAVLASLTVLIVVLAIVLSSRGGEEPARAADALWDGGWYEDDLGRIQNDRALVRGMKAFEKRTGVRPYLTLLADIAPEELDGFAQDQYEALFGDGDHLLVVYDEWAEGTYYLAGRTGENSAMTAADVSTLLACIEKAYADPDNGSYAAAFGAGFRQGARALPDRREGSGGAGLLLALGLLLAALSFILILFLRKKARLMDDADWQNG